mgnify:CR=1 FL=1
MNKNFIEHIHLILHKPPESLLDSNRLGQAEVNESEILIILLFNIIF